MAWKGAGIIARGGQYTSHIAVPRHGQLLIDMKNNSMKNKGNPKKKKAIYEWIISEIKEAEKYGILVNVEGVNYSSEETAELFHVLEDAVYMKEYLGDSEGRIIQINFDKITGM